MDPNKREFVKYRIIDMWSKSESESKRPESIIKSDELKQSWVVN